MPQSYKLTTTKFCYMYISDKKLMTFKILTRQLCLASLSLIFLTSCGGSAVGVDAAKLPTKLFGLVSSNTINATFSGKRTAYTITRTGLAYSVTETATGAVSALANTVQTVTFDDFSVNLDMGNQARVLSAADLKTLIELYIAFFNRVPDAGGLSYWMSQVKGGMSLDVVSETFYNLAISPEYSALTGYTPTMSVSAFIGIIYKNVLGRDSVDAEGLAYWTAALAKPTGTAGAATRGTLVRSILAAAHNYKADPTYGTVADLLDNKYTVGYYFTIKQGLTYTAKAADAYALSIAVAAKVTPTDTNSAIAQIGSGDASFDLPYVSLVITSASTSILMYKKLATITFVGQNLESEINVTIPNCSGLKEVAGGSATQRSLTCTPTSVGSLPIQFTRASNNTTLLTITPIVPMPQVTIKTTMGDMVVELDPVKAPITSDNFLQYTADGFYTGTIFHRVISNFMIQGGGFNTSLAQLPTRSAIKLEVPNGLSNVRGSIAMARTSVLDSATAQFFINVVDNVFLDTSSGGYAVFGKVVSGIGVADAIKVVPTITYGSFADIPSTFVIITSVTQTQ